MKTADIRRIFAKHCETGRPIMWSLSTQQHIRHDTELGRCLLRLAERSVDTAWRRRHQLA